MKAFIVGIKATTESKEVIKLRYIVHAMSAQQAKTWLKEQSMTKIPWTFDYVEEIDYDHVYLLA